ncbi:uncharacterized protein MYCFIDRAFT_190757 [Pseudocercospora fijiensis CIRAD86]|uniref:Uncharacterized protein n=1 Tax=Pseudocercospora fijiensis (strain CIRAD86) TaxID=383855 RepID=M2YL69_PSEFD|nr:uncharacterized protein MYCFIDRAFT_190757 [Pseudocercospora fijiensis CIRAD86]EME78480.1 hypothetical protein MYCFIDRAFT_190757 [Pseudocercospora fijiensis CIRAD86]
MPRLSSLCALSSALLAASAQCAPEVRRLENANYVFNAIHSSMRQWGSSLSPGHNGMSFFIATLPKGQQLYHGTGRVERINDTEWLAFEPEHALHFARSRRAPPPGRGGPPGHEGEPWHPPQEMDDEYPHWHSAPPKHDLKARHIPGDRPLTHTAAQRARADSKAHREPLLDSELPPDGDLSGYLHTYRAKHDIRLLYLDGQSAAKSDLGTLDSQDVVLLHGSPPPREDRPKHARAKIFGPPKGDEKRGPMNEAYRAAKLCEMAQKQWQGKVDGFLRMELGFEIILCSFKDHLEVERITRTQNGGGRGGFGPGCGHDISALNYYQAVASRFDGIGGDRVRVDYEKFVTLFTYPQAHYFNDRGLPRAVNESKAIVPVLDAVTDMILDENEDPTTNWQAVTDLVVSRYSDRIERITSGSIPSSISDLRKLLEAALRPFIDYSARNATLETFPSHAIMSVTSTLCSRFLLASEQDNLEHAISMIQELKDWLGWSTWKRCRGCEVDEVCFVPIWPMGGKEDMENPRCISNASEVGSGYWGGHFGGPPPPPF